MRDGFGKTEACGETKEGRRIGFGRGEAYGETKEGGFGKKEAC